MIETNMDSGCILELPAVVDLAASCDLAARLKSKAEAGTKAWLDASKVETLTLPGIQVVLAAIKPPGATWVVNPSEAFARAVADHGLPWDHRPEPAPAAQPAAQPQAAAPAAGAGKRILTIDDSKTMRDMLMLTLSGQGFDVLQAVDGQDGIEVLEKERESVDVVITDINMPKLDGYGVIEHMRNKREYDAMPILVLTTESDKAKKERARDLGATGFIVKPFNPASLVDVIRKVSP
jgi:two-component system, chemotaxis family, chemotaxis protein CheY